MVKVAEIIAEISNCVEIASRMDEATAAAVKNGAQGHELTALGMSRQVLFDDARAEAMRRWTSLEGMLPVAILETLDDILAVVTVALARIENAPTDVDVLDVRRMLQNCTTALERLGADRLPGLDAYPHYKGWPVLASGALAEAQRIPTAGMHLSTRLNSGTALPTAAPIFASPRPSQMGPGCCCS